MERRFCRKSQTKVTNSYQKGKDLSNETPNQIAMKLTKRAACQNAVTSLHPCNCEAVPDGHCRFDYFDDTGYIAFRRQSSWLRALGSVVSVLKRAQTLVLGAHYLN